MQTPLALQARSVSKDSFNSQCSLPYNCTTSHIEQAMNDFVVFLNTVNSSLHAASLDSLDKIHSAAGFSTMLSDFMVNAISKNCPSLSKNNFHNGHPDILPTGSFHQNSVQHSHEGIEIKCSKNKSSWQGHNAEASWLIVFEYEVDEKGFWFRRVSCAKLLETDWTVSGRKEGSRRTQTASINKEGRNRLLGNWVYKA